MEACEINPNDIVSVEIRECHESTYDLHVKDNHNYCITAKNIIVHNSGKSAKQTLVKNGIPAIEVEVKGGGDKIARARMATPYVQAGMVYIRKSLADRLYNDSRQGILNFPQNADKDLADALAQAIQRISRGAIVSTTGTKESVLDAIEEA